MNPLQAGKVKKMDVTTVRQIRQILEDNLPSIMEENNLKFDLGNGSYDDDSVKFQLFKVDQLFAPEIVSKSEKISNRKQWELPLEFLPLYALFDFLP